MFFTEMHLIKKRKKFDSMYIGLHQNIRSHGIRVGIIVAKMAEFADGQLFASYNLDENKLSLTFIDGGAYHDLGKGISLSGNSNNICGTIGTPHTGVHLHSQYTVKLLSEYADVLFNSEGAEKIALDMGQHHHEHHDGSGYPCGMKGEEIPFVSQLCAIADALDNAIGKSKLDDKIFESAVKTIIKQKNTFFSPESSLCFELAINDIYKLYKSRKNPFISDVLL